MRSAPCVTTPDSGSDGASLSKRPRMILRSAESVRRYVYVALSVRLPRHSVCPILLGVRSFLNWGGGVSWVVWGGGGWWWEGVEGGEGDLGGPNFCGDVDGAVGDVEVADHEDEAGGHGGVCVRRGAQLSSALAASGRAMLRRGIGRCVRCVGESSASW